MVGTPVWYTGRLGFDSQTGLWRKYEKRTRRDASEGLERHEVVGEIHNDSPNFRWHPDESIWYRDDDSRLPSNVRREAWI